MQVFTPTIFDYLGYIITHEIREKGEFQLTSALALLAERESYLAFEASGERFDMGIPYGLVETQLALALHSQMRQEIVASVIRILASQGYDMPMPAHKGASKPALDKDYGNGTVSYDNSGRPKQPDDECIAKTPIR
jgi:hypothetical protein